MRAFAQRAFADGVDDSDREVRQSPSITMPPRAPTSRPQARASSSRGRMPAENTTMSVSSVPPSAKCMRCRAVSPSSMRVVFLPVCTRDAQRLDARRSSAAAAFVDLHGHQPRRELDHVRLEAQILERLGGFEAEQAAADHHAARGVLAGFADGFEVFDGAIDEAAGAVAPGNRRHERARAGGEHQLVVFVFRAALRGDALVGAIDRRHRIAGMQLDAVLVEELARGERQVFDASSPRKIWRG